MQRPDCRVNSPLEERKRVYTIPSSPARAGTHILTIEPQRANKPSQAQQQRRYSSPPSCGRGIFYSVNPFPRDNNEALRSTLTVGEVPSVVIESNWQHWEALLALEPTNRIVLTTSAKMTANNTA
jgi:hypothetical protein